MGIKKWRASAVRIIIFSSILTCIPQGLGAFGLEVSGLHPTWGSVVNFVEKPAVTDVRVKKLTDKTRVVIDVSRPTNLRYDISSNGTAVFLQFPNIEWIADPFEPRHSNGNVLEFRYSPSSNGGRFNILTDGPVSIIRPILLKPNGKYGHRIVIDLVPERYPGQRLITQRVDPFSKGPIR